MANFYESSDPTVLIFRGKNKSEGEKIMKYALPTDLWFRTENENASAVYLRGKNSYFCESSSQQTIQECCQLAKNCCQKVSRMNKAVVIYTRCSNIVKKGDGSLGKVTFLDLDKVYRVDVETNNDLLKTLQQNKTTDPVDLQKEHATFNSRAKQHQKQNQQTGIQKQRKLKGQYKIGADWEWYHQRNDHLLQSNQEMEDYDFWGESTTQEQPTIAKHQFNESECLYFEKKNFAQSKKINQIHKGPLPLKESSLQNIGIQPQEEKKQPENPRRHRQILRKLTLKTIVGILSMV